MPTIIHFILASRTRSLKTKRITKNLLNGTKQVKTYLQDQGTYREAEFKSFQDFYTTRSTKFLDKTLQDLIYDTSVRSFSERSKPLNYYTRISGNKNHVTIR